MYDRQEKALFRYAVYNGDFSTAICNESYIRYPTDVKLLWASVASLGVILDGNQHLT